MTLHQVCEAASHASCYCGAKDGQQCTPRGPHYARVSRACQAGLVPLRDFAEAIHDDVFTGGDILVDPEAVAA